MNQAQVSPEDPAARPRPGEGEAPDAGEIHVDWLSLPGGAWVGMTHCPGRRGRDAQGRLWQRDLHQDIDSLVRQGVTGLVSLIEDAEFPALGAAALPRAATGRLRWLHMPVVNMHPPGEQAHAAWLGEGAWVCDELMAGRRVVFHCAAGLGRTGTVVAKLLTDVYGLSADDAVARVRRARPGTIESLEQEAFVRGKRFLHAPA